MKRGGSLLDGSAAYVALVVGLLGCAGCTEHSANEQTAALREQLLDDELARLSTGLAIVEPYIDHNLEWTCTYAALPTEGAAALASSATNGSASSEALALYPIALRRIYAEEEALCDAYRQAADEISRIVRIAVSERKPPSPALYMFYAKPRGIMRDVRASHDRLTRGAGAVSKDRGFLAGMWLGFEIAPQGELALGLFSTREACEAVRFRLSDSEVETRDCRTWSSEPLHAAQWEIKGPL